MRYPSSAPSHLAAGQPFQLVFDKAVVASSEVGKPLKPGLLSVSPDLKFSSKWIAPNVLECRPQDTIPFRASYEWKPEEGARFQDGSLIPQDAVRLTGRRKMCIRDRCTYTLKVFLNFHLVLFQNFLDHLAHPVRA